MFNKKYIYAFFISLINTQKLVIKGYMTYKKSLCYTLKERCLIFHYINISHHKFIHNVHDLFEQFSLNYGESLEIFSRGNTFVIRIKNTVTGGKKLSKNDVEDKIKNVSLVYKTKNEIYKLLHNNLEKYLIKDCANIAIDQYLFSSS